VIIKKILFPTKFRELAFDALDALTELKKVGLKQVVLLHVIEREEVAFVPYGGYLKDEEERLEEIAKVRFEEWQEKLGQKGIESKIYIVVGNPVVKILSLAGEENVDLIVAGRKKRKGLQRLYIGSTMLDLLRRTNFPVLTYKYMCEFEKEGAVYTRINERIFEKPLIVTDWSAPSERVLEYITGFKGLIKKVSVIHVLSEDLSKEEIQEVEKENKKKLEAVCNQLGEQGIKASSHVYTGKIEEEVLKATWENKNTLIAMGTTGKGKWREFWLGSTSHRIAELAEVPVLLIP